jgi:hypothetical protein
MDTRMFRRALPLAALLALGAFGSVRAQVSVQGEASIFTGGTWFLTDPPDRFAIESTGSAGDLIVEDGRYRDGLMLGANAGVRVAERFGFEGFFAWIPTRLRADSGLLAHGGRINADSYMWGVTALYHFTDWERLQPFVGLGLGGETMTYRPARLEGHTELQGNAVVGANYWVTDVFGIRFDLRDCLSTWNSHLVGVDDEPENDLMLGVGVSFRTGPFGN